MRRYIPHRASPIHHWIAFVTIVGVAILTFNTFLQMRFYAGRALPRTRIGTLDVSNMRQQDIGVLLLDTSQSTQLTITTDKSSRQISYYQAGLGPDIYTMSQIAVTRAWWHLIVPAPILALLHSYNQPYSYAIDTEKVSELTRQINETDAIEAADAKLSFDQGQIAIIAEQAGAAYTASELAQELSEVNFSTNQTVKINPAKITANTTTDELKQVEAAATKTLQNTPSLVVNGKVISLPAETITDWLTTTEQEDKTIGLAYKSEAIKQYVDQLNATYFTPAQAGTIQIVDGAEVSRTAGQNGTGIDSTAAIQSIIQGLTNNDRVITLPLQNITPTYTLAKNYSNTNSGLYSLLSDLVTEKGDYAISVTEIGGAGRASSYKGNHEYVAASTYKVFIAYYALLQAEAGALDFTAPFAGLTIDQCFDLMIEHSDNYCAGQFINLFSRPVLTDAVHAKGFADTRFDSDTIYTTADDLTKFMVLLATGQLVNTANTDKLLNLMKHQIYRNGIPTAATDSTVANKVGYVNGYRHDTGIVYGPKATYAISVTSYGGSYPQIVDIVKKVHAFMQQ